MNRRLIAGFLAASALVLISSVPALATTQLNGDGSSFDKPLFLSAFSHYSKVQVNYPGNGSGAGQTSLCNKLVDFGSYDVPILKTDTCSTFKQIVQLPVALGGISIIYHLDSYHGKPLRFTGAILAQIYQGKIRKWNAKKLVKYNHGLKKVKDTITVVHRSDSSGTSYAFTDFLSKTSSSWKNRYGASKLPAWPVGVGGAKSGGVDAAVKGSNGTIGYVETSYAVQNNEASSFVQTKDHTWVQPTLKTIASDASHIKGVSPSHFSIAYSAGAKSYPISTFSWTGVYKKKSQWQDGSHCKPTVALFKWLVGKGEEKYGPPLVYPKLPGKIVKTAQAELRKVKC